MPFTTACAAPDASGLFDPPPVSKSPLLHEARRHREHRGYVQHRQGPFEIIVSLARQQVALYGQDGFIARADISTGMPGHATPMGVFTVISKARWHESNIYSGAPMPYMQRITWSGIALHAGPRPGYPASHGCIRLPESFAIRLFHTTKVGTRVIVTRYPVEPVEILHPKLFVHRVIEAPTAAATDNTVAVKTALTTTAETSGDKNSDAGPPVSAANANMTGTIAASRVTQNPVPPLPISVFVSRKESKVSVRQGFTPLFDLPVTIADPDRPFGTHVFTAMALKDDGSSFRWMVVSIPSSYRHQRGRYKAYYHRRESADPTQVVAEHSSAAEALDRITLPPEAVNRISALMVSGSSLIISDNKLSDETDADTDFIVLTP